MLAVIPEEFLSPSFEETATQARFLQRSLRKDPWRYRRYKGGIAKDLY
jgi:hypothetical protein